MRKYAMAMKFLAVLNPPSGSLGMLQQAVHGRPYLMAQLVEQLGIITGRTMAAAIRPVGTALEQILHVRAR